MRKVYQPVDFEAVDAAAGHIRLHNRQDFADLSGYDFAWSLAEAGTPVAQGTLSPATAARGTADLAIPLPAATGVGERVLTVTARARANTIPLVPAGMVMAWEQFALPATPVVSLPARGTVSLADARGRLTLTAGGAVLAIDRATGLVDRYAAGRELLAGGAPNFHRAPTDNDLGTGVVKSHALWKTMSEERRVVAVTPRRLPGTWRSGDIQPHGRVSLMVDLAQAGVGGDTAWSAGGRPHGAHRLPVTEQRFGFRLSPIARLSVAPAAANLLGPLAGAD